MQLAFFLAVLIMSVVIHEVSHGYMARYLGDHTAEYEGRLTLNPLKHLDPFGSLFLPALTYFLVGFTVGWAKPVPYNPYNLRPSRWSEALVAAAGPASNLAVALIFGLVVRGGNGSLSASLVAGMAGIVLVNVALALFNLVPIVPLDGSKILFALLPQDAQVARRGMERASLVLLIVFIFFLWQYFAPLVDLVFSLITGLAL
jgi:Zn-dependent protease